MPTHIISFDNDDDDDDEDGAGNYSNAAAISASAPPTCLNTPTMVTSTTENCTQDAVTYDMGWSAEKIKSNDADNVVANRDTASIVLDVKPVDWGRR